MPTFVQLEKKELDEAHFTKKQKLQQLCKEYQIPFVINDEKCRYRYCHECRWVHVGQSDMEAGDVRAKLGQDKIIGVSAQTVEQAVLAEKEGRLSRCGSSVPLPAPKADAVEVPHETLKAICEAVSIQ